MKCNFKNYLFIEKIYQEESLVYFNNDIQYGSKYILKRITDIILSITYNYFLFTNFYLDKSLYILFR